MFVIAIVTVFSVYGLAKATALGKGPRLRAAELALFLTIWPGMRTEPFAHRGRSDPGARGLIVRGAAVGAVGLAGWVILAQRASLLPVELVGWLGVFVILLTVHLGLCDVLSGGLRLAGYGVRRLFRDPLASRSLREFWSARWNLAFVEMNQVVFVPWLRRYLGRAAPAGAFVLSGLLHELAISLPVLTGFGLPTLYFTLHAVAVSAERRLGVHRWPAWLARAWTWSLVLVPLPLLFHRAFREAVVLPLFGGVR